MPISNYPNGFSTGLNVHDNPIDIRNSNENVFWVDSNLGSDGNKGTFLKPFATVQKGILAGTSNKFTTVYVAAGHTETIVAAEGIDFSDTGVKVIGLGVGDTRPTFTFTTSVNASISLSSDSVSISNMIFVCNIASQVTMLDVNGTNQVISNCTFKEGTATGLTFVDINGGGANNCDGSKVIGCEFLAPTAGNYTAAIELGEVADGVVIDGCTAFGDFDDACIHNPTGKVLTNLTIENCTLTNNQAGDHAIELVSACTGVAKSNFMVTDTFATVIDPGSLYCFECYSNSSADKNGRLNPVVET